MGNHGTIILFMVSFNFCGYNRMNINIFWPDQNLSLMNYLRVIKTLWQLVYSHLVNKYNDLSFLFKRNRSSFLPEIMLQTKNLGFTKLNYEMSLLSVELSDNHCSVTQMLINTNKYWAVPHTFCRVVLKFPAFSPHSSNCIQYYWSCLYVCI